MRYFLALILCVLAYSLLAGCSSKKERLTKDPRDVVDRDFAVLITSTSDPLTFYVEVKTVNPKADKLFRMPGAVVDLILTDTSGHVFRGRPGEMWSYAKALDDSLEVFAPKAGPLKGRVRLLRRGLRSDDYTVHAVARIWEQGKDAVRGRRYADMGSVAVPSGNSVRVHLVEPWLVKPLRDPNDVLDRDFAATITPTKTPFVYEVEVRRVNNNVDKHINNHSDVFVDLELVDAKGRILAGDFCIQTFAEYVGDGFMSEDTRPHLTGKKGRVRLVTSGLPAGTYMIRPVVRIPEEGKDRVLNPRADLASVAVPAENAVRVTIE